MVLMGLVQLYHDCSENAADTQRSHNMPHNSFHLIVRFLWLWEAKMVIDIEIWSTAQPYLTPFHRNVLTDLFWRTNLSDVWEVEWIKLLNW